MTANRRRFVRYQCAPATSVRVCLRETAESGWQQAWALNLSQQGIGLLFEQPPTVGQSLHLPLKTASGQILELLAQVVHVTPHLSGGWLVGCQFQRLLSVEELESLLQ
jgi:hypothetical protein